MQWDKSIELYDPINKCLYKLYILVASYYSMLKNSL